MKEKFNKGMLKYDKNMWTLALVAEAVKKILTFNENKSKRTNKQYNLTRKYGKMEVDGKTLLVKKVSCDCDPVIVVPPVEEYFDILLEFHCLTGQRQNAVCVEK